MTLYLVVPCFNEEAVLPQTIQCLTEKLQQLTERGMISPDSRLLLVDDGSRDKTWELIEQAFAENRRVEGLKLSRNRGHQNALLAGLMEARSRCDAAVSLDADLQDDVDAIDAMTEQYLAGCEIVFGVRDDRRSDSMFKRATAQGFYRLMNLLGAETVYNHADYRLMSRRALDALAEYPERNLFLRGLVPMLGFRSGTVFYSRRARTAGTSKYPLKKMLSFAWEGITSLSTRPVRLVWTAGWILLAAGTAAVLTGKAMLAAVLISGGLQLLSLGIVGEYVGKIYLETKRRPRYHMERKLMHEPGQNG